MESRNTGVPPMAPGSLWRGRVRAPASRPRRKDPLEARAGRQRKPGERADGGALGVLGVRGGSRPPDSRGRPRPWRRRLWSRTPRLSGDAATSDGGPRRPGMAAWSPAAAVPLLRGTRRVSADGDRATLPGAGTALGPRGGRDLDRRPAEGDAPGQGLRLPFSHSLIRCFIHLVAPATGTERSVRPGACWGSSPTGWGLRPRERIHKQS